MLRANLMRRLAVDAVTWRSVRIGGSASRMTVSSASTIPLRALGLSAAGERETDPGLYQENIAILVARDRRGATFDAVLPWGRQRLDRRGAGGGHHAEQPSRIATAAGPLPLLCAKPRFPLTPSPRPASRPPEAPHLHLHIKNVNAYHSRLKQWLARFNGVATKNLPNYLGCRRALEAWGDQAAPQNWIKSALGNGSYLQLTR
jgi:hypothetical protein